MQLYDVVSLSRHFVEDDTNVVDIGCSTGKMTQRLLEENKDHSVKYHKICWCRDCRGIL